MKSQVINFFILLTLSLNLLAVDGVTDEQEALLQDLPIDQRQSIRDKMLESNKMAKEIEDVFEQEKVLIERPEFDDEECTNCIFGYNMFQFAPSTFAPSNNVPISSTYRLGPGDKVEVEYYGTEQASIESFISRDGTLYLPLLGPINLAGLSIEEAKEYLEKKVEAELIGTSISFNLTELRSINVYVLGQAYKPGTYTLSALSSVINALYLSGGPNSQGSLRNIKVRRGDIEFNFDLYNLIVFGKSNTDIRLEDGDIIFIPFIEKKVSLLGGFKRPSIYEFIEGETISDALTLAGGFSFEAGNNPVVELSTININNNKRESTRKLEASELNLLLSNGDSLSVSEVSGIISKSIKISGEVNRPGTYSLNNGDTVLSIIERAGGYTEEAFTEGIVFTRKQVANQQKESFLRAADTLEKTLIEIVSNSEIETTEFSLSPINNLINKLKQEEPIGRQVVNFDILTLKTDPISNFKLFDGDTIYVPDRPQSINVVGEVLNSTTLQFNPDRSVDEYINLAGGLSSSANKDSIFIIYPNGQSYPYKKRLFNNFSNLVPGSTIVVSRNTRSFDAISLTKIITPIFADLATSAAAIAAISND